ncbi:MAG: nucleotidyltransferase domain-containing protein [Patescibacteria group bacterium]
MLDYQAVKETLAKYPAVKLAYLFGSRARNEAGPLSDYDFAVYAEERDLYKLSDLRFSLMADLSRLVGSDAVDVVMLNTADSPELKYHIIADGQLIYEEEPYRVLIEPRIMSEYFDLKDFLQRYQLTKAV